MASTSGGPITVGIDIGTTSVKAIAADEDGRVVARTRVPHRLVVPAADRLEHDPNRAWRRGVRRALAEVRNGNGNDNDVAAVVVAAMVPSLAAVSARGGALSPGLLYGDARGGASTMEGEFGGFLRWLAQEAPTARGYWPAQAMANHALCGRAAIDSTTAFTAHPVFDGSTWDEALVAEAGTTVDRLPEVVSGYEAVGEVDGALLGGGAIDAFSEQLVAGADNEGDVLVICGTTLITWAVISDWIERPGLWTIPHTTPGKMLIGGPSNAGGLFLDWAVRQLGRPAARDTVDPARVPVWLPYVRGERTPLHRPDLRAHLHDLDLTHTAGALRRAAYEAAGFVVRHHLDRAELSPPPRRIVATGGGVRSAEWLHAIADCTRLPVDVVAVPEGGALGSAFVARCVAGLESSTADAARWARVARTVEPDPAWVEPCAARYERFVALTSRT